MRNRPASITGDPANNRHAKTWVEIYNVLRHYAQVMLHKVTNITTKLYLRHDASDGANVTMGQKNR
jgi:hypothetical protein